MAAAGVSQLQLVELKKLSARHLDALLTEEAATWNALLKWDFEPSAALVRQYLDLEALEGFALLGAAGAVGYCYYVFEDRKAVIGDLYVRRAYAAPEREDRLLAAVLASLRCTAYVDRLEAQLMLLQGPLQRVMPLQERLRIFPRALLLADLAHVARLPAMETGLCFTEWSAESCSETARLISHVYRGHVDAEINDQYRSIPGAQRFVQNIVHYPGCGAFHQQASLAAWSPGGTLEGICLASRVAPDVGHITQICVSARVRRRGVGYELLRRSLLALAQEGFAQASLTVTLSNESALRLYRRMGFREIRRFGAYVWEVSAG